MKKPMCLIGSAIAVCFLYMVPLQAMVGVSFQWGFDYTLDMEDSEGFEPVLFNAIKPVSLFDSIPEIGLKLPPNIDLDSLKDLITENEDVIGESSPITLSRSDWNRTMINFGGKIFFDEIPVIDAIEISFNIGAWEYESMLKYPTGNVKNDKLNEKDISDFVNTGDYKEVLEMDSCYLTMEQFDMLDLKILGITKTPYVKLQFDLTIRKNIIAKPDDTKIFKLYLGAGPSLHLGTPILTPQFVEDVIGFSIENAKNNLNEISENMSESLMEDILAKLLDEGKTPTWGMHIIAGTMIKPPIIPIGIYFDAKFMIPFGEMDDSVELEGLGFLLNGGVALTF